MDHDVKSSAGAISYSEVVELIGVLPAPEDVVGQRSARSNEQADGKDGAHEPAVRVG